MKLKLNVLQATLLVRVLKARHEHLENLANEAMLIVELVKLLDSLGEDISKETCGKLTLEEVKDKMKLLNEDSKVISNVMDKLLERVKDDPFNITISFTEPERKMCFESLEHIFSNFDDLVEMPRKIDQQLLEVEIGKMLDNLKLEV